MLKINADKIKIGGSTGDRNLPNCFHRRGGSTISTEELRHASEIPVNLLPRRRNWQWILYISTKASIYFCTTLFNRTPHWAPFKIYPKYLKTIANIAGSLHIES